MASPSGRRPANARGDPATCITVSPAIIAPPPFNRVRRDTSDSSIRTPSRRLRPACSISLTGSAHATPTPRLQRRRTLGSDELGDHVGELAHGAHLEDAGAVGTVHIDQRIVLTPIRSRLGVEPEQAAGAL